MSHFRFHIGPIEGPLGPLVQAVSVAEDGSLTHAPGSDLGDAMQRLDAGGAPQDWNGTATIVEAMGDDAAKIREPNERQCAALLRHVLPYIDPRTDFELSDDGGLIAMMTSFAFLAFKGAGLPAGTSQPFHFRIEGDLKARSFVVLSAADTRITCATLRDEESLRHFYETAMTGGAEGEGIDIGTLTLDTGPGWAGTLMKDIMGHRFAPSFFFRHGGKQLPLDDGTALVLALLAGSWPDHPGSARTHRATYAIKDASGEVIYEMMDLD